MALMIEIGDRAAQGRACGNLGNVHYLLGNFSRAIHFHQERLKIGMYLRIIKESAAIVWHCGPKISSKSAYLVNLHHNTLLASIF